MCKRLATISLFIEDNSVTPSVNAVLHEFSQYIIGRMGLPYRDKGIAVISLIIDAPADVINNLSGKLGMIDKIFAKTIFSKI